MKDDTASNTARLIARVILLASRDSRLQKLVAPKEAEISEAILQKSAGHSTFRFALSRIPRSILLTIERILLPGIAAHYLVRKRKIETTVRKALHKENKSVVVIAAGYDTLCIRLRSEFPRIDFVEIDHPATQKQKQGASPKSQNLHLIPADLTKKSVTEVLRSSCIKEETRSVFVIEGLTMYLTEENVQNLFSQMAPYCGKLIFTFMEKDENGDIGFRGQNPLIDSWLKARKEPFLWGITRADLPGFLAESGFEFQEVIGETELRAEFLAPLNLNQLALAKGELLCIAAPSPR